jgi:hypothetical protein
VSDVVNLEPIQVGRALGLAVEGRKLRDIEAAVAAEVERRSGRPSSSGASSAVASESERRAAREYAEAEMEQEVMFHQIADILEIPAHERVRRETAVERVEQLAAATTAKVDAGEPMTAEEERLFELHADAAGIPAWERI